MAKKNSPIELLSIDPLVVQKGIRAKFAKAGAKQSNGEAAAIMR